METGIKVGECMTTHLVTISGTASAKEAAGTMAARDVGSLLVVDSQNRPTAIVTESDLVRKCLAKGECDAVVAEIATKPLVTITPDADLSEAAKLMGRKNVKRLVVTDGAGNAQGIISQEDIVKLTPSLYDLTARKGQ
ncbi:MAG: CBS domain-containing protein [Candidatus Micrarchaeota archaeon]